MSTLIPLGFVHTVVLKYKITKVIRRSVLGKISRGIVYTYYFIFSYEVLCADVGDLVVKVHLFAASGCIRVYCFVPSSNIDPPVLLQPPSRFLAGDTFYGRGAWEHFMGKLAGGQDLFSPNVGKVDTVHIFRRFWSFKPGFVNKITIHFPLFRSKQA